MLYKNLVCARKDPVTDNIFIESYVFELKKIGVIILIINFQFRKTQYLNHIHKIFYM